MTTAGDTFLHVSIGIVISAPELVVSMVILRVWVLVDVFCVQIFAHISSDVFSFAITESLMASIHLQNGLALSITASGHSFDAIYSSRGLRTLNIKTCLIITFKQ